LSVLSTLQTLSQEARPSPREAANIKRTTGRVEHLLKQEFGDELRGRVVFGSLARGTNLSRLQAEHSDVDYMVVFAPGWRPDTYLDRLNRFATKHFSRWRVRQSAPAIVVQSRSITLELVPAVPAFWTPFKVPASDGSWRGSDPDQLRRELISRNADCGSLLKPAIRLAKLWNARNGYVLASHEIEVQAIEASYPWVNNLRDYFFAVLSVLALPGSAAAWRQGALGRAKHQIAQLRALEGHSPRGAEEAIVEFFAAATPCS
jgi:predicted nucleotidyltransferase